MPVRVAGEPRWLGHGIWRLAALCAFVVLVGMVRWRLSTGSATVLVLAGVGMVLLGATAFLMATRRLAAASPLLERPQQAAAAALFLVRRTGLPLLGLIFFLAWTFVYIALWAIHPDEAFQGLDEAPRFADFFFYSVSTAFAAPPADIVAASRGARSATMIEMLTGVALVATYIASLFEMRKTTESDDATERVPGAGGSGLPPQG